MTSGFTVLTPATSLDDALAALETGCARIIAGGTDLFPALNQPGTLGDVIDISGIPALRGFDISDTHIRIGAATNWTEIAEAELPPACSALQIAARQVGGRHIQNAGTLAGNICNASPAADGVPPLLVLDAEVELRSRRGTRSVPIGDFVNGNRKTTREPDELVTAISFPSPAATTSSAFEKLGSRSYLVISIAMVATLVRLDQSGAIAQARVAVGACSPVAQRLWSLENDLIGQDPATPRIDAAHLTPLSPIDDARGTAPYRLDVVPELIRRALEKAGRAHG